MADVQVCTDLPVELVVDGHFQPAPFYLTADMFGGLPFQLAGGEISDKVGKPVAEPHRHDTDEIYFLISPNPGGARITVTVEGTPHELVSPAVLKVPAGARHCFVTTAAEPGSFCFGLLLEITR